MDLLEDALDAERHHRHDPEQSEDDRRVAREQPGQQEQATCCLDSSQRKANGVLTENERRNKKPVRGRGGDQGNAERDPERERACLRIALQRADRLRLGHAMLDQIGDPSRTDRHKECGDDRPAEEKPVLGRMRPRIGEPLDVQEDSGEEGPHR